MIKPYKCLLGITTSGDAIPEGLQLEWWSLLTNYHNLRSIRRFPFLCRSEVISVLRSRTRSTMKNLRRLAKVPSPPMSGSRGRQKTIDLEPVGRSPKDGAPPSLQEPSKEWQKREDYDSDKLAWREWLFNWEASAKTKQDLRKCWHKGNRYGQRCNCGRGRRVKTN